MYFEIKMNVQGISVLEFVLEFIIIAIKLITIDKKVNCVFSAFSIAKNDRNFGFFLSGESEDLEFTSNNCFV